MRIRAKMLLVMLPLIIATASVTGILSASAARSGMTRLAVRHHTFKVEQLAGYMKSQWDLLLQNEFETDPAFVRAAQSNVRDYARSLVRSPGELIVAVNAGGLVVLQTAPLELDESDTQLLLSGGEATAGGWVDLEIGGEAFVGQSFYFAPFRWHTFLLERKDVFLAEVRQITRRSVLVVGIALVGGTILALLLSVYLTRPLSHVVQALSSERAAEGEPIPVEYQDEIGELAERFNMMTDDLSTSYQKLKDFAFREALARKQIIVSERETLLVLARAAEYRDPETSAHINRVGLYARLLGKELGLDEYRQGLLYLAAPLHDIGKLGVPEAILQKPGALEPSEFDVIQKHPFIAHEVLKDSTSPYLKAGAVIGLTHHERYDGSGYPQGLRGEDIPLFGRIVGIVDVFDALTTKRPYKEAWTLEQAARYLEEEKGRLFDPALVDLFLGRLDEVRRIYEAHPAQ